MNFTPKSRKSTVKHKVKSRFWRPPDNFCRKNTGFSVDFRFLAIKRRKKHVYFTVLDDKISPNTEKTQVFGRFLDEFVTDSRRTRVFVDHIVSSPPRCSELRATVERHASDINASVSLWVRQSTVKNEETSKFRWFANNFCRKNTGFSVDFHFFDDKKTKKHVYFTVFRRQIRRKHDKTHGFERKKVPIRKESVRKPFDADQIAATSGETSGKCAKGERHTLRKRKSSLYGFVQTQKQLLWVRWSFSTFFSDKKTKKHVYFTVSTRPKRREHDKTHGFERFRVGFV